MLVLRCTGRIFRRLKAAPRFTDVTVTGPTLGQWCVNTVDFINGGNTVLACMHLDSLYLLLIPVKPPPRHRPTGDGPVLETP